MITEDLLEGLEIAAQTISAEALKKIKKLRSLEGKNFVGLNNLFNAIKEVTDENITNMITPFILNHFKTISANEKIAMRAYLQRCEVRLSTMQRIAGVFLNGAGLLVLLPVFFKDAITNVLVGISKSDTFEVFSILGVFAYPAKKYSLAC